jgi:hypothetical protein
MVAGQKKEKRQNKHTKLTLIGYQVALAEFIKSS